MFSFSAYKKRMLSTFLNRIAFEILYITLLLLIFNHYICKYHQDNSVVKALLVEQWKCKRQMSIKSLVDEYYVV